MVAQQVQRQRAKERTLTAKFLRSILIYDPITGIFTRRVARGNWPAGAKVGKLSQRGYVNIRIGKRRWFRAHRLAWLYMTGKWPKSTVDHIDRNRDNNVWTNLRDVDQSTNVLNSDRSDRAALKRRDTKIRF